MASTPLARACDERGISVRDLATLMKLGKSTTHRWMTGERPVPRKHQYRVARMLGMRQEELFR